MAKKMERINAAARAVAEWAIAHGQVQQLVAFLDATTDAEMKAALDNMPADLFPLLRAYIDERNT